MAAEVLIAAGIKVDLYDAMPSVGRKFLMAGKGGMNITHAEPYDKFVSRYGTRSSKIQAILDTFTPQNLRDWVRDLGLDTFIGSSGRVFPTDMKAAPLLRAWLHRLRGAGVRLHMRYRWMGWVNGENTALTFSSPAGDVVVKADAVVLALGGASWPQLGSNAAWVPLLAQREVMLSPLKPSNCGFNVAWGAHFKSRFSGLPLKSVAVTYTDNEGREFRQQGELMLTDYGVEGGIIYSLSAQLRDQIVVSGSASLHIDLLPNMTLATLMAKASAARGKDSMANHLRKRLGIDGVKAGLLREVLDAADFTDPTRLCTTIKSLPIKLLSTRPIEEAISSAGGVSFEALDPHLMVRGLPGVFCAGEMLDWEAPTGGYLLSACFAMGRAAGLGVVAYLEG